MPTFSCDADFVYLGGRSYVHGTTMFARFLTAMDRMEVFDDEEELHVGRFNIRRELRGHDGRIDVHVGDDQPGSPSDAEVARMRVSVGAVDATFTVQANPERPVIGRDEQNREAELVRDLIADAEFSGTATVVGASDLNELIRGIVEVNKRLHVATLGGVNPHLRWVHLKDFRIGRHLVPPAEIAVRFDHLSAATYGDARFTRSRLSLADGAFEGEVGFSYQAAGGAA